MTAINGNILQWYKKARKFEKIISISVLDHSISNYRVKEMSIINGNLITIGIDEVNNKSFIGIKGNYGYSDEYIKFEEFENTKILSLLCIDDKVIFITKSKVYTLNYNINSDSFETTFKNFPLSENLNNEIKLIGDRNNIYFYDYNKIYEINITDGNISYILSAPENSLISSITINDDKLIISRQLDNKLYIYNRTEISNNSVPVEYKISDDDVIPTLNSSTAMDLNQNILSLGLSDGRLFIVNLDNGEESNIGSLFSEISYVDSNGSYSGFIDNEGSIIFYDRNLSKIITIEVNSRSIEGTSIGSNSKSIIDFKMDNIFLTALNNDNTVDLYKLEYIPDLEFNYHMIEKRDGKGKENDTFFLDVNAKLISDINNAMDKTPYEVELYTNIEKKYLSGDAWANNLNGSNGFTNTYINGNIIENNKFNDSWTVVWNESGGSKEYTDNGIKITSTTDRQFGIGTTMKYNPKTKDKFKLTITVRGTGTLEPYFIMEETPNYPFFITPQKITEDFKEWTFDFEFPEEERTVKYFGILTRGTDKYLEIKNDSINLERIYDYEYVGKFDSSLGEDRDNPNNYHWSKRKQKISTKKLYQEIGLRKNLYLPLSDINDVFASNLSLYMDSNSNDNKSSIFYKIKNKNNNIEINNNEVKLDRIKKLFIKDLYKFDNDLFFRYMFICNNPYTVKLDFNNKASTLIILNESKELYENIFNLFNPKSKFELKIINNIGIKQYTISNLIPKGKYTIKTDYINKTSQYKDIFFTNNSEQTPDSINNGVDMNKPLTISANEEGKLFISLKEESSGGKLLVRDLVEGKYNIYLEPTPDIDKNEIYDISNYQEPFTKFHLFKLKNVFDIINDDKFNINITLYSNGKVIETSSINNLDYREVFPNKDIKYKTSDGDIKYIEELLLTELEQGNKDRFMHNNSLVPQNRVIPNSEISISNGTYVGEEVNDEGLTGYITIPFNARDIGDLYKSDYIIMDIYVNGYKLDRKYAKERYNLNDGSLRVDYPVKNIYRFISDDEYNQISSGIIPDSVKFMATIRRKSLISSEKVIGKYRVTDQFQNDIEMLQSTGIYIPFVGKDSDLTSSELRLFIRNKVNSLARRVNPDNYTMRLDKQNKQVLVKLNGTTNIEIGSEIIIASNGLLDNTIYYINNNRDYPMDSLPLVTFDSENNMYTGLIYDEEDIDISVNGLTLIPKRDYNILDPDIDSIPSMITFKNYIPLGSTIEINYLEEKTNHVFNWDNPVYGTQNRFVLDDDRFIFVKGTFELFVNNLKLDNESFNIINNRTIEIINIEAKYLKNVMVRFSYRDHTNLKLIQDSYKFNNIDINDNGYHSKFEGKSPNNFDKLSNGVSTDISKILLMNKLNTNDKLVIDCNDDNLQSDIYLDSRYIDNQYINRNISINANSINRINEDFSINNPEI